MADSFEESDPVQTGDLPGTLDKVRGSTDALGVSAAQFSRAMSKAFTDAVVGGKQLDDVLKSMALKLSDLAVKDAFRPITKDLAGGLKQVLRGIFGPDTFPDGGGSGRSGGGNCGCCGSGGMSLVSGGPC